MIITDNKLKSWIDKAHKAKTPYTQYFLGTPNLWFRVSTSTKIANFIYRITIPNQTKTWFTIGEYPAVTLHQANDKAPELRKLVKQGINPRLHYKQLEDAKKTVRQVYDEMVTGLVSKGISKNSIIALNTFNKNYLSLVADFKITDITAQLIRHKVLDPLIKQDKLAVAHNALLRFKQLAKFAYEREYTETNVIDRLANDFFTPNQRDRVLNPDEIIKLVTWCKQNDTVASKAILLALTLGTRKMELLNLQWHNVNLVNQTILLTETKNGSDLLIKLPPQAMNIINELHNAKYGDYVFTIGNKQLTDAVLVSTIKKLMAETTIAKFTPHDLRRTFSSQLAEQGFKLDLIDSATNHKLTGVRRSYVHTMMLDERYSMLCTWANFLDEVAK